VWPPVIQLTFAYGAGLWVGLVFVIPHPVNVLAAAVGLVVAGVTGWRGTLGAAASVGLLTAGLAHQRALRSCASVWSPGPHVAIVAVHDPAGRRGLTTVSVLAAVERCGGELRVRTRPGELPAGAEAVLVGTYWPPTIFQVDRARVLRGSSSLRYRLRDVLARRIGQLYGPRAPFVEALVLGRRDDLDPKWRDAFTAAGIAHLLAISGLHVGIVAGWAMLLARLALTRSAASWITAVATWAYVTLLGLPAPAVRAAALITCNATARLRQRHPPPGALLATSVLVVLAVDPLTATQLGAWLSVAATWGTGFALRQLPPSARRRPALALLAASLGATLATAPITAYGFGMVAPVGLLTNLVAVPLAGLAVPGIFASLVFGGPVAGGTGLVLAALEHSATLAAAMPGGQVRGTPGAAFALPWLLLLVLLVWLTRSPPLVPARPRSSPVVRGLAALAAAAWASVIIPAWPTRESDGRLSLYILDVGQGDAIVLRTPHGHWAVIDGGPRSPERDAGVSVVLPFLRKHGAHGLDLVIATHGDADHLGGIPAIVGALDPDVVLDPGQPLGTPLYLDYLRVVEGVGSDWHVARAGDTLRLDSVTLAVLHPAQPWVDAHLATNENSVVVRVTYGAFDAILTGDAGVPAESALVRVALPSEVLKVGHHGSAGATSEAWLDRLRARAAVISVGPNRYGHPSPDVLQRLERRGIEVFRTDRGGTVTIRSDGRYFEVVQGGSESFLEGVGCLAHRLLPSSVSSSSRNACTLPRRASFPTFSTTSPSPGKSSRDTSGGPAWSMYSGWPGAPTSRVSSSRSSMF
jgi:competence protein ComEC